MGIGPNGIHDYDSHKQNRCVLVLALIPMLSFCVNPRDSPGESQP